MLTRAGRLLEEIQHRATERVHRVLVIHRVVAICLLPLPVWFEWWGVAAAALLVALMGLGSLFVWHRAMARAVAETALVYGVVGRVAVFRAPAWRVVGAE